MFGYIKPYIPEMKMKEHEAFRGVYCGLCHQLGHSFGVLARLTLNYDFVFLALLYFAQQEELPVIKPGRCCVNPLSKVPVCSSVEGLSYSGDVGAIMVRYKLEDNIQDSGKIAGLGWRILRRMSRKSWISAAARQPQADQIVKGMMNKQKQLEDSLSPSVDQACEPTAEALSLLAENLGKENGTQRPLLKRLGYLLGRYIYLCDAVEDLDKDLKSGNYNPLIYKYLQQDASKEAVEGARQEAKGSLYMTIGEMGQLADQLEFAYFGPILHNILQYGLRNSAQEILEKKGGSSNERSL